MKVLVLFLVLLPFIAFANDPVGFSSEFKDYKSYFAIDAFDGVREYDYVCSYRSIRKMREDGTYRQNLNVAQGHLIEESSNGGLTVSSLDSEKVKSDGQIKTHMYNHYSSKVMEFIDDNTLKISGTETSVNLENGEYVTKHLKTERIRKLENGVVTTTSYKVDGIDQKEAWKGITAPLDPFGSRFLWTGIYQVPEKNNTDLYEVLERSQSCIYTQTGIKSYVDLIPKVIVGAWILSEVYTSDFDTLNFNSDGTFEFHGKAGANNLIGEYKVVGNKLLLKSEIDTKFREAYQLEFKGFNEVYLLSKNNYDLLFVRAPHN